MAIKTRDEMLGDGAGFGTAVPYSTTNPSGYGAGNRGIGFGEQVTSAIANRTHNALALNDEDLDARISPLETAGLDAAYDLAAIAMAGGGRIIVLDGGPVETQSALSTLYADDSLNAHYRASALGDSIHGSTGFDFVGDAVDPDESGGGNGGIGYLDRRILAFPASGFATYVDASEPSTLNPSGAGGDVVELDVVGRKFWTDFAGPTPPAGTYTNLHLGYDLLEISGTAGSDGIYLIYGLGSAEDRVQVRNLNMGTPTFPVSATCTVRLWRVKLGTFGSHASRRARSVVMVADRTADSALDIVPSDIESSSGEAVRVLFWDRIAEEMLPGGRLDKFGRFRFGVLTEQLPAYVSLGERSHLNGGAFASRVDRSGSSGGAEIGHMVHAADNTVRGRFDFMSLTPISVSGIAGLTETIPFTFVANSPVTGLIDLTVAGLAATAGDHVPAYGVVVEIIGGAGDSAGFYILKQWSSANTVIIGDLDNTVPTHLPTSGSGTLRFHAASRVGFSPQTSNDLETLEPTGARPLTFYNVMTGGPETDSCALSVFSPGNALGTEDRALVRCFVNDLTLDVRPMEIFSILPGDGPGGDVAGLVVANNYLAHKQIGLSGTSEVLYTNTSGTPTPRSTVIMLSMTDGQAIGGATGIDPGWRLQTVPTTSMVWQSLKDSGYLMFPLNAELRNGMVISNVEAVVNTGTSATRLQISLCHADADFATPGNNPVGPTTLSTRVATSSSTKQVLSLVAGGFAGHTVTRATKDYYLVLRGGDGAAASVDLVYGIRITVTDPGPRNG